MKTHKVTILPHLIKFIPQIDSSIADDSLNLYGFDLDHTIIQPKVELFLPEAATTGSSWNLEVNRPYKS